MTMATLIRMAGTLPHQRQLACLHLRGVVLQVGQQVSVGVRRHRYGRVAEQPLRLLEREVLGQEPRGEEGAQRVEAVFGAPDRLARGVDLAGLLGRPDLDLERIPTAGAEVRMAFDVAGVVGEDEIEAALATQSGGHSGDRAAA